VKSSKTVPLGLQYKKTLIAFIFTFVIMLTEQGVVNGQLLIVLGTKGSTSHLEACGLKTVGDQLRFKQLVDVKESSTCSSSSSLAFVRMHRKKPSRDALKDVGDLNKRILHAK